MDGVDEADIVKSDGEYVYAAYGDLMYVWKAQDGTKGLSITEMPYVKNENQYCKQQPWGPFPEPMPIDVELVDMVATEEVVAVDSNVVDMVVTEEEAATTSSSQGENTRHQRQRHRRESMMIDSYWDPCYQPKPRILSLLLSGKRLTAIVSEQKNRYYPFGEGEADAKSTQPIVNDRNMLFIRVYDISDVPTDSSPLPLVGEKEIKGNYNSARSINNKGIVMATSNLNLHNFADGNLHRHKPQYCGVNSSEYEKIAAEYALNSTDAYVDQIIDELQLQMDGTCDSIFQVAAMQSGNSTKDATYDGNLLGQFVQVLSFDMSSDYEMSEDFENAQIGTNLAGGFSSGYINSVYASQDFVSTQSVGSSYNEATGDWDQNTFVLGFDTGGDKPKPYAFAEITGSPLNQYSVDLWDGHLRIATTETRWFDSEDRTTNKISVLKLPDDESSTELKLVGETEPFGKPNEMIYAVRYMDEKAYVVTFERSDPFYVFNLTDHANPVKLGELSIPGFSEYLYPIVLEDKDGQARQYMLGLGRDVDEVTLREGGVKISLFDVSSPTSLTENATFIDKGAYSSAGHDYKSFRYLPLSKKLILPKSEYNWQTPDQNFDGFVVYDISVGKIEPSYEISHASSSDIYSRCWYNAYMPARSFVFEGKLTTILSHTVKSTDLNTGNDLWNLTLDGINNTQCSPYFF